MAVLVNISFSVDGNAFAYNEGFREQLDSKYYFKFTRKARRPFCKWLATLRMAFVLSSTCPNTCIALSEWINGFSNLIYLHPISYTELSVLALRFILYMYWMQSVIYEIK